VQEIGLGPLEEGEDKTIASECGENLDEWCKRALDELGRIPRYIQFFLENAKNQRKQKGELHDRQVFFSNILEMVKFLFFWF
jgi:hypothetical protein